MNEDPSRHSPSPPPPSPASEPQARPPLGGVASVETLRPVAHLELKAAALLLFTLALIVGSGLYLLYARGAFEPTQTLVLTADDSEGVVVGMDMTFSGFPIGRVRRIELADEGNARILVDVPRKDAHWLRDTSVFTLVRGIVGGTNIRAYTGMLNDKLLPDGAVRPVLRGDATAEIPQLMASARDLLANLNALTAADSALGTTLGNVQVLTGRMNGTGGVAGALLGGEAEAKRVVTALDRANALLARLDALVTRADKQVLGGPSGQDALVPDLRAAVGQLNGLLADTRSSLTKVDAVLVEAQAVGANAREATTDLGALRAEVESNLRKVESLVNDINRKWPFAKDTELKLP
jgi:phospholipid/cholesterol/gamma-HCH transport system substrate-binding protein